MWMRFYTQGKFSWRKKSLCTGMGGEGEIIVHNAAMNQNPKPKLVLLLPCCCSITFFLHQLQTSITFLLFFMLEHFFRPFLKTRSYDRSAHTFGSSHRFLEVPHKGVFKQMICWHFLHLPKVPLLLPGGRGWD